MAKDRMRFICAVCGYESPKWLGRCPGCETWNSLEAERVAPAPRAGAITSSAQATKIEDIEVEEEIRLQTGMQEADRVLGGGLVPGTLVLLAGEPGIGKSTLLLQSAALLSRRGKRVLYVSAEESSRQVAIRARRLGLPTSGLVVLPENNVESILAAVLKQTPDLVVIDSIQTVYVPDLGSGPGTVSQVRDAATCFMKLAKASEITVLLCGQVTKEGFLAGPKVLEHIVDVVLYMEGDSYGTYRLLRCTKNRYGSTNEVGVFEMTDEGLKEVRNPSECFLAQRPKQTPGSVVVPCVEGTRPLLVEVQALVGTTPFPSPRRTATGIDQARLAVLCAVIERKAGVPLANRDVYVKVAGGLRLVEPAADLGIALAIISSSQDRPLKGDCVVLGEVGLAGEVRSVTRLQHRLAESSRLGFRTAVVPRRDYDNLMTDMAVIPVASLVEALEALI